jgi:hypothetical protein
VPSSLLARHCLSHKKKVSSNWFGDNFYFANSLPMFGLLRAMFKEREESERVREQEEPGEHQLEAEVAAPIEAALVEAPAEVTVEVAVPLEAPAEEAPLEAPAEMPEPRVGVDVEPR